MKNFLLPWLDREKSPLRTLPNNPINKLEQSSSFNTPDGGFLENKAPMTPISRMSVNPNAQKYKSEPPMTKIPQSSNTSRQTFSAPMSIAPKMSIALEGNNSFELPSFTDFQNQNFIPDPLKSFTPTYNANKPKLEIPSEQSKINEKNKVISNDYNQKRNAMYSFMADVQKNEGGMSREMIEEHYPEFADNIESALQLQAEIAPIVSRGEAVDLKEIHKYYPELLSEPKFLKSSQAKEKDDKRKEYLKKIATVDQNVLSDEGKKYIEILQWVQELATQVRANYQVPKDITDTEIANYVINTNPELQKWYQEGINAKLSGFDKAHLWIGWTILQKFSATAQNLTHRANTRLSENVVDPYMQASEEFAQQYPNLSLINAPVKGLLQIPHGALHGADKALTSMQRLWNADYKSKGEIISDGIKGVWWAGEIGFNTALAPITAKFNTLANTKWGKIAIDNSLWLLNEGLENIFQSPWVKPLYNALDDEAREDLKNWIILWLLHKAGDATKNTRFNAKMAIKTATDAFSNAIQKGINSGRFQIWVEKGLANENGRFQDGALGRIVKEGVSEFQTAFKENFGKFSDVLKTRRQQVNTLTDQRGFVETTKSEIKEGMDSVKEWVKKAWSIVKAGTENLIGGIKKKINDLNTKSKVQPEGEIKAWSAWSEGKINESNSSQTFSNFNRKLLQNQNRIDPSKIVEFEKKTGKKYGDYMLERGRVGWPEENVGKMAEYINTLKEQKRQAFEKMSGVAQSEAIGTLLTDIVERATQVRDPDAKKFTTMLAKHSEGGISFPELEEAKRRYERNIKTWYYKDNNSVWIQRATNLDTEIRKYQQEEAIKQGFTNIKELNKEISNAYFLSNEIMRKQLKMDANNQVSLTDYLMLGAMPDNVGGFAGLALKMAMKNKTVKNTMLHAVARLFGNHKNAKEIKVDLEKIEKMADQKAVADAIGKFMKKWKIEEPKALPEVPEATVIWENWPQVKNPLTPEPMRRKVVEIDRRPKWGNVLGDTIARNAKPVNKRGENAVGLKTTKKTWNSEKTEYTSTEKSSSITSPWNIRAGLKDPVPQAPVATTFSFSQRDIKIWGKNYHHKINDNSFKTKHIFNQEWVNKQYVDNFNNAIKNWEKYALIGKYKGNDVKLYLNKNFWDHFVKHWWFAPENLVETINNYDAVSVWNRDRYIFEKELPNGKWLRAITTKNFSEITFFETKNKFKWWEVIEKGLGNLREWAETRATKLEQKFQRVANNYKDQVKKVREKWDSLEKAKGDVEIEDSYWNIYHSIREIDNKIDDLKTESYRYNKDNWTASDRAEWSESYDDFLNDLNTDMDMFESLKSHYEGEVKRLSDEVIDNMPIEVRDLLTNNKRTGGAAWEQAIQAYVDWDAKSFDSMMKNIDGANYRHNNTSYDEIRQKEASGLSEEAYKEYRKEFNTDVETDYGWLITGEEPAYQRVNWNPKYGVADATEKTITPERAKELKNIRNGKSVEEIANDYGVAIEIADKITTPEGIRAYGKYGDGVITLAEKIKEGTAPHELFHATFDIVDHARKESILEGVMEEKKLDKVQAEEYLADSFSEYFRTWRMKGEKVIWNVGKPLWKKLYDAVKDFFRQVKDWITGVSKNKNQVKNLFDDILDGEIEKEMLWEILGNKKGTDTHRHQQSWPRLVSVPVKSSISITPENASIFTSKLNNLSKVIKNWGFTAADFLDGLKNNLNIDKKSWYLISQKNGSTATLRISDHYANARNNKIRWYVENNTSIVIKLWGGKFKAKNGVDLVEFVYNPENLTPEKMQGIIKGIQDWIDTGEYTDKNYDLTHKSIRATLEGWEVKYQRVYHGSPYEFEKFDSAHIGKGEGAQAHGWGHYVAVDRQTGARYANVLPKPKYQGNPNWQIPQGWIENSIVSNILTRLKDSSSVKEAIRKEKMLWNWYEKSERIDRGLKFLDEIKESDFEYQNKNLYEVEIPDNHWVNYLEEQKNLNPEQKNMIKKGLVDFLVEERWFDKKEAQRMTNTILKNAKTGDALYSNLTFQIFFDKKEVSKFLDKIGFDWIHYNWGIDWEAYVIFDNNKLEIKKHEKL